MHWQLKESGSLLQVSTSGTESELVVQLFATLWTLAHQASLSMDLSRQEYWSGLPFPSPGDLLDLGIKRMFPALQAESSLSKPPGKPRAEIIWSELRGYV